MENVMAPLPRISVEFVVAMAVYVLVQVEGQLVMNVPQTANLTVEYFMETVKLAVRIIPDAIRATAMGLLDVQTRVSI
jgi:uncharacterized protein (DUF2236 family)